MSDTGKVRLPTEILEKAYYPGELEKREMDLVDKRRKIAGVKYKSKADQRIGLALSGGGIRSATFSLGVLQSFAKTGFLRKIDFLSTVSGGGYIGGYLGKLFLNSKSPEKAEASLKDSSSDSVEWLRQHGRYLSPSGLFDNLLMGGVVFRNWVAVYLVYLLFGFFVAQLVMLADFHANHIMRFLWKQCDPDDPLFSNTRHLLVSIHLFLIWIVPTGWGYWLCQGKGQDCFPKIPSLTVISIVSAAYALGWSLEGVPGTDMVCFLCKTVALSGSLCFFYLFVFGFLVQQGKEMDEHFSERVRSLFTKWFWPGCFFFLLSLFLESADWLSGSLVKGDLVKPFHWAVPPALASAVSFIGNKILNNLNNKTVNDPGPLKTGLAGFFALSWFLSLVLTVSVGVHWLAYNYRDPNNYSPADIQAKILAAKKSGGAGSLSNKMGLEFPLQTSKPYVTASLLATLGILAALCFCIGNTITFLNFSSYHPFYRSRLVNAYLKDIGSEDDPEDSETDIYKNDISIKAYRPFDFGGPIHLISATINETVSGKSNTEQQDRKGLPLIVGPCSLTVSRHHHALWTWEKKTNGDFDSLLPIIVFKGDKQAFHVFDPQSTYLEKVQLRIHNSAEKSPAVQLKNRIEAAPHEVEALPLGAWLAISGAAFGTGQGANTNIFYSLLLGLANIRLGYWWNSNTDLNLQKNRKLEGLNGIIERVMALFQKFFPVYSGLADELFARFHGTARQRWYLSDGGHFENTGCYELLRRQVPFIILCDNGQDPNYQFEDLGNLVLKARNDFQAEITLFEKGDLQPHLGKELLEIIGTREDFKTEPGNPGPFRFKKHALLAWVDYSPPSGTNGRDSAPSGKHSILLILKPSLSGDESSDILFYQDQKNEFPQESTVNQFYSEAEWESYRKLGEHIAEKLMLGKKGRAIFQDILENLPRPKNAPSQV